MIGGTGNAYFQALRSLIDALCYPIRFIDAHGPLGGIVAIVLGVAMLIAGDWIGQISLWGFGIWMVGLAYCGFGLSRFVGLDARLRREYDNSPVFDPMTKEQLAQVIATRSLPFFVCTRCRIAMEPAECGGVCPKCGSETDCLPVSEDADRRTVDASIY